MQHCSSDNSYRSFAPYQPCPCTKLGYVGIWGAVPSVGSKDKASSQGLCPLEAIAIYFVNLVLNCCRCRYIHSQGIDTVMSNVSECDGTSVHYAWWKWVNSIEIGLIVKHYNNLLQHHTINRFINIIYAASPGYKVIFFTTIRYWIIEIVKMFENNFYRILKDRSRSPISDPL